MLIRNLFWPAVLGAIACLVASLVLLGVAAGVGIATLSTTFGVHFVLPLTVLAAVGVLGLLLLGYIMRTGLGN